MLHPHRLKTEGPPTFAAFIGTKIKEGRVVGTKARKDERERLQASWYASGDYTRLYQSVPEHESYGHES